MGTMMSLRGSSTNTAAALHTALKIAEDEHARSERPQTTPAFVGLLPEQIEMRVELFQPREFSVGLRKTDPQYVKKLARQIGLVGELDPILVIRFVDAWICIDGHHRVEAYKRAKWATGIKCEWFAGTVREAVDVSIRRNRTVKLEVPLADRQEQAWKRTLMGWGSKREVREICGIAEGTIAFMRRVKDTAATRDKSDFAKAFRRRLGKPLEETTWSIAKLTFANVEPGEIDLDTAARRLARSLRSRHEDRLSRNPQVTARALAIYDQDLPEPLTRALQQQLGAQDDEEAFAGTPAQQELRKLERDLEQRAQTPTEQLTQRKEALTKELQEVAGELARRESVTPSTLIWDKWVLEAKVNEEANEERTED